MLDIIVQSSEKTRTKEGYRLMLIASAVMRFALLHSILVIKQVSLSLVILCDLIRAACVFSCDRKYTYVRYKITSTHWVTDRIIRLGNGHRWHCADIIRSSV